MRSIVALHGLNGHAFGTWEYTDKTDRCMWLRDFLPEHVPAARVLTYGYNANVLSDVSTGRLRSYAETFLEALRRERSSDTVRAVPIERVQTEQYATVPGHPSHYHGTFARRVGFETGQCVRVRICMLRAY